MNQSGNPILSGDWPDPSILRHDGAWYMTFSSLLYRPSMMIVKSDDLVHWQFVAYAFNDFDKDIWAPDLTEVDGHFYIYFYAEQENWVIHSNRLESGWSAPLALGIPDFIDPGHVQDPITGQRWLFLGKGMRVPLSADGLRVTGKPEKVIDDILIGAEEDIEGNFIEGPKLFWRNGWVHCLLATGGTAGPATGHRVLSLRSRSLDGGWERSPYNPVLVCPERSALWQCRGHGSLTADENGNSWLIYHAYRKDHFIWGRQCLAQPVRWHTNGWFTVEGQPETMRFPAAASAADDIQQINCDFSRGLPPQWRAFRRLNPNRFQFGNALIIQGEGESLKDSHPLLLTIGDDHFTLEAEVRRTASACPALCLFYNEEHGCAVELGNHEIRILRHNRLLDRFPYPHDEVGLKLEMDDLWVRFYYRAHGRDWLQIANTIDVSGWHHNSYDGFLSLKPGLTVSGSGTGEFRNVRYEKTNKGELR